MKNTKSLKDEKGFVGKHIKEDHGFSLLELVVAVGILLTLTLGGTTAYGFVRQNAREAAVNNAADQAFQQAVAAFVDGDPNTEPNDAEFQWNESSTAKEGSPNDILVKVYDITCEGDDPDAKFYGVENKRLNRPEGKVLFAVRASMPESKPGAEDSPAAFRYYEDPNFVEGEIHLPKGYTCKYPGE